MSTTHDSTTGPGNLILAVADGTGDYHDGEPTGTVDLAMLKTDMNRVARRLAGIPGLITATTCDGGCDAAQMLSEIAAEADLAALADDITDLIQRLTAVWAAVPNGAAPDLTPQDERHQAMGGFA